jgi:hypothetical protein
MVSKDQEQLNATYIYQIVVSIPVKINETIIFPIATHIKVMVGETEGIRPSQRVPAKGTISYVTAPFTDANWSSVKKESE